MSVLKLKFQAYQVSIVIIIASIFSPFFGQDCKHIGSQSLLTLHAYLVPIIKIIAIIFSPPLYAQYHMHQISFTFVEISWIRTETPL